MTIRSLRATVLLTLLVLPATAVEGQEIRKLSGVRFSYPTYTPSGDILYESMADGNWNIYRMPHGQMEDGGAGIERLTETSSLDRMPSMSPDGRYIAFISDRAGNFDVWRMDADGGNPIRLTTTEEPEIHPYWTPDSRRIVYNKRIPGERLYAIWSMAADGTDQREILRDDELNSYAQVSPDGRFIVFDKWWQNEQSNGEIMLLELATGELTRLTANDVYDGYPTWFPDRRHVLYASEVDGLFKLFRMDITTREREQLTFGPGSDQRPAVSADGTRILFNRNLDNSIEIYELVLDAQSPAVTAVFPRLETYPEMSPDGRFILYSAEAAGKLSLYRLDLVTREVRRLTHSGADDSAASWAPDGTRIVFQRRDSTGQRDLWEIDSAGAGERNLTNTPAVNEQHPRYSADGRLIVFDSNRDEPLLDAPEDQQNYEIYTLDRRDGAIARITRNDGWDMYGSFSPDGTHIVWRRTLAGDAPASRNFEIVTLELRTGRERNLSNHPGLDSNPHWSPTGAWIVFVSARDSASNLYVVRPDGTGMRRITTAARGVLGYARPSFTRDGASVLANRVTAGVTDMVIIPVSAP